MMPEPPTTPAEATCVICECTIYLRWNGYSTNADTCADCIDKDEI